MTPLLLKKKKKRMTLQAPETYGTAGIDEAGVGPWAGPVVAAAVAIQPNFLSKISHLIINDSKKLTSTKRESIFLAFQQMHNPNEGFDFSIGSASVDEIDKLNIRNATHLAMCRALENLTLPINSVFVDGNHGPKINIPMTCIVKGDQKILSISMASIIAKVYRDRVMEALHEKHPCYNWIKNAGYGTKHHKEALEEFGITAHHRKSYAPIRAIIDKKI